MVKLTNIEFQQRIDDIFGKGVYSVVGEYKSTKERVLIQHNCEDKEPFKFEIIPNKFLTEKTNM